MQVEQEDMINLFHSIPLLSSPSCAIRVSANALSPPRVRRFYSKRKLKVLQGLIASSFITRGISRSLVPSGRSKIHTHHYRLYNNCSSKATILGDISRRRDDFSRFTAQERGLYTAASQLSRNDDLVISREQVDLRKMQKQPLSTCLFSNLPTVCDSPHCL
jgi:hypothetical protein